MTNECRSSNDERGFRHSLRVIGISSFFLLASLVLCGCGKKKMPAKAKAEAPIVVRSTLLTESARLGLAERVPGDVEFCVSSVNFRQHAEALRSTNWWKQTMAFVEEQLPAADGGAEAVQVDEAFVAFGKESGKGIVMLRQLNDLYNETAYRGMMSGGALAGLGTSFDVGKMLEAALRDSAVLEALILWLERFEMPPMMVGVASPEPEKALQKMSGLLRIADWLGDAPQSRIVTTQGEQITVNEIAMNEILTLERRRVWLEALVKSMPLITPETRDRLARGLEVLARKKWVLALGLGKGRAYVALGRTTEQVRLANSVEDSMLARSEMRFADDAPAKRELGLMACWDGAFLNALQSDEPFHPLLRGLLAGLEQEQMFAGVARSLSPLVVELGAAEQAYYRTEFTNGAAVAWWDAGLHLDWAGRVSPANAAVLAQGSQFTPLLDDESVVLGVSGQSAASGAGRAYFEAWMKLAHAATKEVIGAGVGGEKAAEFFKLVDQAVLPSVREVYDGTKTIWQKALGTDGAFILDVGGKMPLLPGLPPGGQDVPLPRLTVLHEMKNRALIGVSWQNIETALQKLAEQVPLPQPLELPQAIMRQKGPVTSYAYTLPFESEDLLPCVSLTDRFFMLGTSRALQSQWAESLGQPGKAVTAGTRVKLSFTQLREFLKAFAVVRGQGGNDVSGLKQAAKWLEPLEVLELRKWSEGGLGRGVLSWKIHDVLSYD
jgi:hypothetical protein